MAALCSAGVAQAQWSGSATVESDYRFRGVSLGGGKPSVRLAANYDGPHGWYAGAAATQSQVAPGERYGQLLGYAGFVVPLADAALDLGATTAVFVGERRYDFSELSAGLLFQSAALRLNYSPDYFGRHVQTVYLDASGSAPIAGNLRLIGHAGVLVPVSNIVSAAPNANRVRADARVGVGWSRGVLDVNLAWSAASRGGPPPASASQRRAGWVLTAAWFF